MLWNKRKHISDYWYSIVRSVTFIDKLFSRSMTMQFSIVSCGKCNITRKKVLVIQFS